MERHVTGETDQEYQALYDDVWSGYLEAQATRDFLVKMTKKRRRQDRALKFAILVCGSGAAASGLRDNAVWLVVLALITAVLSAISLVWQWGLEKQRFQVTAEQQTEHVDAWQQLWEAIREYQYDKFSVLQRRRHELVEQGRQIYNRAQEYEPDETKRTEIYDAVYRRMGVSK